MVQLALAARLVPQVLVSAKLAEAAMLLIESAPVPVFVKVMVCAALVVPTVWLAKVRLVGDKLIVGVAATAVPLSDTACGLAAALSVNVIDPVSVPAAVGVKVTEIVQLAPAGRLDGQAVVSAKLPEAAMPLIERAPAPVFVKVTVCAALVVPTVWLANVRLVGDKLIVGVAAAAVPLSDTACGLAAALSVNVIAPVSVPAAVGVKVTETGAAGAGSQAGAAGVGLGEIARGGDAGDRKRSRAAVLEGNGLSGAGGPNRLAGKGQAGGRQTHRRRRRLPRS